MIFIGYDKCSTCIKAKRKLSEMGIPLTVLDVKKDQIDKSIFLSLFSRLDNPNLLFNTAGKMYREMGLSKKILNLSLEEKAQLLSENGMLIKRPLLFDETHLLIGYREAVYESLQAKKIS